jgi:hypothetical protein
MEEVQVDDTNNNNDESNNNNTQKQQQQQLHSEQLAHQNSSGPKTSEEIQKQSCFDQKEVFKVFMPQGSVYEEYSDPGKACLEAMTERRKTVCLDYMKIGFMQSLAETSEVKHQHMSNIKSKRIHANNHSTEVSLQPFWLVVMLYCHSFSFIQRENDEHFQPL